MTELSTRLEYFIFAFIVVHSFSHIYIQIYEIYYMYMHVYTWHVIGKLHLTQSYSTTETKISGFGATCGSTHVDKIHFVTLIMHLVTWKHPATLSREKSWWISSSQWFLLRRLKQKYIENRLADPPTDLIAKMFPNSFRYVYKDLNYGWPTFVY